MSVEFASLITDKISSISLTEGFLAWVTYSRNSEADSWKREDNDFKSIFSNQPATPHITPRDGFNVG